MQYIIIASLTKSNNDKRIIKTNNGGGTYLLGEILLNLCFNFLQITEQQSEYRKKQATV